jgi:VanZ family protein
LPGFDVLFYDFLFKKLAHMFVYAVLFLLLFRAVNADNQGVKNWKVPILLTLMYACLDEFHQVFTPNRHPSPVDIGYDMLGASVVFLRMYRYI